LTGIGWNKFTKYQEEDRMKKVLALLLTGVILISALAGCGSDQNESLQQSETGVGTENAIQAEQQEKFSFGMIVANTAEQLYVSEINEVQWICDELGCDLNVVSVTTAEENLSAVENLCSSGVDAILSFYLDSSLPKVLDVCESNEVYYAAYTRGMIAEVEETALNCKYFVGCSYEDEISAGYAAIQKLYESGARQFGIATLPKGEGQAADDRVAGAETAIAELDDAKLVIKSTNLITSGADCITDMINMAPEMDGIFIIGAGLTLGAQAIEMAGLSGTLKLGTIDIEESAPAALEDGSLSVVMGGQYPDPLFAFILTYNCLTGNPLNEEGELAEVMINYTIISSVQEYENYMTYYENDHPYTLDEVKSFIKVFNPEATLADLQKAAAALSIEDVIARHGN